MNNLLDFFKLVLPAEGIYCSWSRNLDSDLKGRNRWFNDLHSFVTFFESGVLNRNDYFALATFKESGRRISENTDQFKTFFIDLDCGVKNGKEKEYPTQKAAVLSLKEFIQHTQLPVPTVVNSGFGIHAYWPLIDPIEPATWASMQQVILHIAHAIGLKADRNASKLSQVSRPIDTYNYRPDIAKPVQLLGELRPATPNNELITALFKLAEQHHYTPDADAQPKRADHLAQYRVMDSWPLADAEKVSKLCAQINHAIAYPENIGYGLWFRLVGATKFCVDGEKYAHAWSENYTKYSVEETQVKYDTWSSGPPLCTGFQKEGNPTLCANCKFKDKIISPVQIGHTFIEEATVYPNESDTEETVSLPKGYTVSKEKGIVFVNADGLQEVITPYDIMIKDVVWNASEQTEYIILQWHSLYKNSAQLREMPIPSHLLSPGSSSAVETLNRIGITTVMGKIEAMRICMFLSQLKRELEQRKLRPVLHETMGWKMDNTQFVLGNEILYVENSKIITQNVSFTSNTGQDIVKGITAKGDLNTWVNTTSLLNDDELRIHAFCMLTAFGAPLFTFTGHGGAIINMLGPSGAGKSTIGNMILSTFGDPRLLRAYANWTANSLFNHFSTLQNLPVYVDETTNLKPEMVSDLVYFSTFGEERKRLTKDGSAKSGRRWNTIICTSSNDSLLSKLSLNRANPEAEMMRLLELSVQATTKFSNDIGLEINETIANNFGLVRNIYYETLLGNTFKLRAHLKDGKTYIKDTFNFKFRSEERFWEAVVLCNLVGGVIAKKLNLIKFDINAAIFAALSQIKQQRSTVRIAIMDAFELVIAFISEHYNQINIIVLDNQNRFAGNPKQPMQQLHGLIESSPNGKSLFIDVRYFSKWLSLRGTTLKEVKSELLLAGALESAQIKKKFVEYIGATTSVQIDLNHQRFSELDKRLSERQIV